MASRKPPLGQGQASVQATAERKDKYVTVTVKYRSLAANTPGLHQVAGPIMRAMLEAAETMDVQILAEQQPEKVREESILDGERVVTKYLVGEDGKPAYILSERKATDEDADLKTLDALLAETADETAEATA